MSSPIQQIKDYFEKVLPEKGGIYSGSTDIVFLRDDKLVISFNYSSLSSRFVYPIRDDILKNIDGIMGKPCESSNIETYPKRNMIYITIVYDFNQLDDKVQSKGFRTLLGLNK